LCNLTYTVPEFHKLKYGSGITTKQLDSYSSLLDSSTVLAGLPQTVEMKIHIINK